MATAASTSTIIYPSGDGQAHGRNLAPRSCHHAVAPGPGGFFHGRTDVFIASDIFWYWEEGNPKACIAPDVMVVPGVQPREPRTNGGRSFRGRRQGDVRPSCSRWPRRHGE